MSHVLKNFLFKGTLSKTAFGIASLAELRGCRLFASVTHDHLLLTAHGLRDDV